MREMVDQAMRDGALGLSTGLIYLPGAFAKTDEIIELAKVAARHDGLYATHMRDEGAEIFSALTEVFRIAREAGIRAHISHIKLSGKPNWGQAAKVLAAIEKARDEGLDITQDQYLYTASSTGLAQLIPEAAREGGKFTERLADAEQKHQIMAEMRAKIERGQRTNYAYVQIAEYRRNPDLNGMTVAEAARKMRGSDDLDAQIETVLDIQANGGATGIFHGISEDDLLSFLKHPNTMVASDSGIRVMGKGMPHPRGYGNNARLLNRYVRHQGILKLEDAIRRMTSLPATVFRLQDRGIIRLGAWADLVVFDPHTVRDESTFTDPHHYATGFNWVLVNGTPLIESNRHTGARPGKTLRGRGQAGD
jgi:N-acyl-D-amino-acid deacylase